MSRALLWKTRSWKFCKIWKTSAFNKVVNWKPPMLFKRHPRCCSVNFAKFLKTPILWSTCKQLLLYITSQISTFRKVCQYQFIPHSLDLINNIKNSKILLKIYKIKLNNTSTEPDMLLKGLKETQRGTERAKLGVCFLLLKHWSIRSPWF